MKRLATTACVLFALGTGVAAANDLVVAPIYTPLAGPVYGAQTVYYGAPAAVPQTTYYAPAAVPQTTYYAPAAVPQTTYYAPAPVVAYRPTVVRQGRAVVAYSPAVAPTVAYYGAPVVAYSPVAPAPMYAAPGPMMVPVGRPVVVSTKVYVPGQPVRNFFKAITP